MTTMKVALDAKDAASRAAALQHHMHVKRIHQNRVAAPSRVDHSSTSTYMDKVTHLYTHILVVLSLHNNGRRLFRAYFAKKRELTV